MHAKMLQTTGAMQGQVVHSHLCPCNSRRKQQNQEQRDRRQAEKQKVTHLLTLSLDFPADVLDDNSADNSRGALDALGCVLAASDRNLSSGVMLVLPPLPRSSHHSFRAGGFESAPVCMCVCVCVCVCMYVCMYARMYRNTHITTHTLQRRVAFRAGIFS